MTVGLKYPKPVKVAKPRRALRRKRYMRKKAPRRLSQAGSDPAYLAWVRTQPCIVASLVCWGRIHAHHAIHLSQGGSDRDAVPLCAVHHVCWHEARGIFASLSKLERFAWAQRAIAITRAALERR